MIAPSPDYRPERVQPALSGLMDGSLSTLAPIFAVALATHRPLTAFFTGAATALGAGVSMAFSEGLSDTGDLTGRGSPVLRGAITGGGTFAGGIFHTLPFLIPGYGAAIGAAIAVVGSELLVLAWLRHKFFHTSFARSFLAITVGGAVIAALSAALGVAAGGLPPMEADTMSRPETCRIAATPADYQRYGIAKGEIAAWEDGFRTRPGGPGTFEWWYFDAVLDDGSTLVINFMVKDIRGGRGIRQPARPVVSFELDRPDGTHVERALHAQDDFAFAADRCDVRVGPCTFAGDLHTYRIHVEIDAVTADVTLTGQVPSWRPETGHILFGDDQPKLFAWLPSVPQGAVRATLTVDGETRTLAGTGYHDHNWGDAAMQQLIHHWYWARAQAGGYCVIASDITAERKYGHTEVPIFMLAKDGKLLADDSSLVRFEKTGEHPDPVTGKPVADTTVYDYDATANGGERYRVTFRRENTIVQARMIESVKGPKRVLARIAGFDGAYMRFTGQVTVERTGSDPVSETVTAPALWELMYFGKTTG